MLSFPCFGRSNYVFLLLASFWLLSACQSEPAVVQKKKIYANYYIRYIQDEGNLRAEASYMEGDSIQNRTPKQFSTVLFGNKKMVLNEAKKQKPYYQVIEKRSAPKNAIFRFVNDNGQQEEDHVKITGIDSFSVATPIDRSKDNQLRWEGNPLGKQESIILLFTDERNRTTSMVLNGPSSSPQLSIPAIKLKGLQSGKNSLYLVRKGRAIDNLNVMDPEVRQISTVTEYYTKSIVVEVAD